MTVKNITKKFVELFLGNPLFHQDPSDRSCNDSYLRLAFQMDMAEKCNMKMEDVKKTIKAIKRSYKDELLKIKSLKRVAAGTVKEYKPRQFWFNEYHKVMLSHRKSNKNYIPEIASHSSNQSGILYPTDATPQPGPSSNDQQISVPVISKIEQNWLNKTSSDQKVQPCSVNGVPVQSSKSSVVSETHPISKNNIKPKTSDKLKRKRGESIFLPQSSETKRYLESCGNTFIQGLLALPTDVAIKLANKSISMVSESMISVEAKRFKPDLIDTVTDNDSVNEALLDDSAADDSDPGSDIEEVEEVPMNGNTLNEHIKIEPDIY